jgi:hypothetical protein
MCRDGAQNSGSFLRFSRLMWGKIPSMRNSSQLAMAPDGDLIEFLAVSEDK